MSSFPLHAKTLLQSRVWLLQVGHRCPVTRSGIRLSGVWWSFLTDCPGHLDANRSTQKQSRKKHLLCTASIERNTVPCIPAGPKSCLVRKMAWSWCSACSGSSLCWVFAQRHLLQTPGRIPALYQADGLETQNTTNQKKH